MGASCLGASNNKCNGKHPLVRLRADSCKRARGGTKTVGIPEYALSVVNEPDPNPPEPPIPPEPVPPLRPKQVITISPANGATNVPPVGTVLVWAPSAGATSYSVWINGIFFGVVTGTSFPL